MNPSGIVYDGEPNAIVSLDYLESLLNRVHELEKIFSDLQQDDGYRRGRDDGLREAAQIVREGGSGEENSLEVAVALGANEAIARDILARCDQGQTFLPLEVLRQNNRKLLERVVSLRKALEPLSRYFRVVQDDHILRHYRDDTCLVADQMVRPHPDFPLITLRDCRHADRLLEEYP